MSDFNFFDELRNGNTQKWISYLNKEYMELYAPNIKVYKLDKVKTELDPLYAEAATSRIYLPPFTIRAFHLDNKWAQMVGEGSMPYLETQEDIQFVLNFENMIQIIRDLKSRNISEIYVDYTGTSNPTAVKSGDVLTIKVNDIAVGTYDLTDSSYNTTKKLSTAINGLADFTSTFTGKNDSSTSLVSFNETRFRHSKLMIYSPDTTYENCTDIIEQGDVIMTHKFHVYEVLNNMPAGDFGWDYASFILTCNIRSLDEAELPGDYNVQIGKNEYGLRDKIDMEGDYFGG